MGSVGAQHQIPADWARCFALQYSPQDRRAALVHELIFFFSTAAGRAGFLNSLQRPYHDNIYVVHCDWPTLDAAMQSQDLQAAMELSPAEALSCISIAMHEVLFVLQREQTPQLLRSLSSCEPGPVVVRLTNYTPSHMHIRQLRSSSIGKLATVRGTVVRMSHIRPLIAEMDFVCSKCGDMQRCKFADGKYTPPNRCEGDGCRSKALAPNRSSAVCVDWRKIRLQETMGADKQAEGQVPRSVEVELREDLTTSCMVGDVITVVGLVKVLATGDDLGKFGGKASSGFGGSRGNQAQQQSLFLIYLDAVSVTNTRPATKGTEPGHQVSGLPPNVPDFTLRDLEFVIKFSQEYEGDQLRQLVAALCPTIYGSELVKAGLLLALAGGVRKNVGCANRVPIRGDVHVLLVGDPGLGKSQLLQAVAAASPRGLYVCGNTATGAGLTVSVVKEPVTGEFVFEAGAVVLADRGTCCVDEFDKMTSEHQALLEAMEQQEVSVAKGGLVASLPARTSIVAAANPVEGHYNRGKAMHENLKMSPAMLSRFDLMFILLDRPNAALDQALSEHVMALHSGLVDRADAARQRLLDSRLSTQLLLSASQQPGCPGATDTSTGGTGGVCQNGSSAARPPLAQRLRMTAEDDCQPLPQQLLRKYIAYARHYVTPRLTEEAKQVLQAFYLQLRQQTAPGSSAPVTARQLESLVRLSEARARLDLRESVTREDAEDVIEIMREALYDRFSDDLGCLDFRPNGNMAETSGAGSGHAGSKAAEGRRFLAAARQLAERQGCETLSLTELHALANAIALQVKDVNSLIEQLNDAGELLKKGQGIYRVRGVAVAAAPTVSGMGGSCKGSQMSGGQPSRLHQSHVGHGSHPAQSMHMPPPPFGAHHVLHDSPPSTSHAQQQPANGLRPHGIQQQRLPHGNQHQLLSNQQQRRQLMPLFTQHEPTAERYATSQEQRQQGWTQQDALGAFDERGAGMMRDLFGQAF